jgi:hypothetical protein
VLLGPQLPRKDNLVVHHIARLLGEPGERHRLVYAEAFVDEGRAPDLLVAHRVATGISAAFFRGGWANYHNMPRNRP